MVGIVDCNSFYVSCERVFRPDLKHRPMVVLSNNDGCVVAMSRDLKEQGMRRGAPYFKVKDELAKHAAVVFSSNYVLYQSLSNRVMKILENECRNIEVYSIDEAFIDVEGIPSLAPYCIKLTQLIEKCTSIPISIGVGRTKTLAKAALELSKKNKSKVHILYSNRETEELEKLAVGELWGIGRKKSRHLRNEGITTALAFRDCSEQYVIKAHHIAGWKIQKELKGETQLDLDIKPHFRKGLLCSRSFGTVITSKEDLYYSLAAHANTVVHKLQSQNCSAHNISVYIRSKTDLPRKQAYHSKSYSFSIATALLTDFLPVIRRALDIIFVKGKEYIKSGIFLSGIERNRGQVDIFEERYEKKQKLLQVQKKLQEKYGAQSFSLLPALRKGGWNSRRNFQSPHYTTRWSDIPIVKAF